MKDSKLIRLLKLLSPKDIRQIQKMLQSPYFNNKSSLLALFAILRKHYPFFESNKLNKESLYKKIFPKEDYSDTKIRTLFSDMNRLIEDYLILQELEEEDIEKQKVLLNIYIKKGEAALFQSELNKVQKKMKAIPFRDIEYYRASYDLNVQRLEFMESKQLKKRYELLQNSLEHVEMRYQLATAKIEAELKSFSGFADYKSLDKKQAQQNVVLQIYEELNNMYSTKSEVSFYKVKHFLFKNLEQIRKTYQIEFLTHLINFSVGLMRIDDLKYNTVTLDLYKFGLEHAILIQKNRITHNTFLNIVISASKAKEFDWVFTFMKNHKQYLHEEKKEEITILAKSYYHFHKKEINESIDLLSKASFTHPFYNLAARQQLLRSYYELFALDNSFYDTFIAQCLAFEKTIQRNQILSAEYIISTLHFSKFIRKLATLNLSGKQSKSQKEELLQILDEQKITISRSWLLEKINKMEE